MSFKKVTNTDWSRRACVISSTNLVVYVIQKSNKYGLKQSHVLCAPRRGVVYVIQKSKQYGLKQCSNLLEKTEFSCVCHSKK